MPFPEGQRRDSARRTERLRGRIAFVTGGGTGLGRAISLALSSEGAAVAVSYVHSEANAQATAAEVESRGGRALAVRGDVSDPEAVSHMVERAADALGPVDILVNNAGITRYAPFPDLESLTAECWRSILEVNVVGMFFCVQAAAPSMRARGRGDVVNVAGSSAFTAKGSSIAYVVSKAAVVSLTHCLARALAPTVRVNAVAPGWMDTGWIDRNLPLEVAQGVRSGDLPPVPVDEVASCVVHLVSNESITGQVVVVDRGAMWLG